MRTAVAGASLAGLVLTGCTATADPAPTEPSSTVPSSSAAAAVGSPRASASPAVEGDRATVDRVIDGDTVDVRLSGDRVRVRLLNIDTPETKHPNKAVQCLGPEATMLLESLLEPGDEVVLRYDEERIDPYGRTLAGVFEGGELVNAEIARAGLGAPVVFEPNRRFYPEVLAAWEQAERAGAGLHQTDLACSLRVLADPGNLGEQPPVDPAPVADLAALGGMIASAQATASAVDLVEGAVRASAEADHAWMGVAYASDLPRVKDTLSRYAGSDAHVTRLREARTRLQQEASAAQERAEREAAEAEQRAAQERAEKEAARERAAAERAEQEAAAKRAEEKARERAAAERAEQEAAAEREAEERAEREAAEERAAREAAEESESSSDDDSSSSGSTSQKAPNRCYAPGGETFVYCDEQGSSSSGGGTGSGEESDDAPSAAGGAGGPVSGSGGVCPDGYPVKVSGSGKYHLPGGRSYDDTGAKRCYSSAAAAVADGAVAAKG
nr:thermonuclease family protein [Micrococcus flavus]